MSEDEKLIRMYGRGSPIFIPTLRSMVFRPSQVPKATGNNRAELRRKDKEEARKNKGEPK